MHPETHMLRVRNCGANGRRLAAQAAVIRELCPELAFP